MHNFKISKGDSCYHYASVPFFKSYELWNLNLPRMNRPRFLSGFEQSFGPVDVASCCGLEYFLSEESPLTGTELLQLVSQKLTGQDPSSPDMIHEQSQGSRSWGHRIRKRLPSSCTGQSISCSSSVAKGDVTSLTKQSLKEANAKVQQMGFPVDDDSVLYTFVPATGASRSQSPRLKRDA